MSSEDQDPAIDPDELEAIIESVQSRRYDPSWCRVAIETMARGLSESAAAGALGVSMNIFRAAKRDYPDFRAAVEVGNTLRIKALEQSLLKTDSAAVVRSRLAALAAVAPDEWRPPQRHELSGPDGGPIRAKGDGGALALLRDYLVSEGAIKGDSDGSGGKD